MHSEKRVQNTADEWREILALPVTPPIVKFSRHFGGLVKVLAARSTDSGNSAPRGTIYLSVIWCP